MGTGFVLILSLRLTLSSPNGRVFPVRPSVLVRPCFPVPLKIVLLAGVLSTAFVFGSAFLGLNRLPGLVTFPAGQSPLARKTAPSGP